MHGPATHIKKEDTLPRVRDNLTLSVGLNAIYHKLTQQGTGPNPKDQAGSNALPFLSISIENLQ